MASDDITQDLSSLLALAAAAASNTTEKSQEVHKKNQAGTPAAAGANSKAVRNRWRCNCNRAITLQLSFQKIMLQS